MPNLGDYLGQLLAEISIARMQADLETVRIAELYAAHPLLRTLPVPHVRLPEVNLEIPVLVKTSEEPRPGESARGGIVPEDARRRFDEILDAHITKAGIRLSPADRKTLRTALDERLNATRVVTEVSVDVNRLADELTSTALKAISELKPPTREQVGFHARAAEELRSDARLELLKLRKPPPRLAVAVTSAEIREAASSDNVIRLQVKISEQGLEWTTIESDGEHHDRLVPE